MSRLIDGLVKNRLKTKRRR